MTFNKKGVILGSFLLLASSSLMGCQYEQLKNENDSLYSQNKELQDELARSRAALDAAEADRRNLASQRMQQPVVMPTTAAANTGFSGIQGVEAERSSDKITVRVSGDVLFPPGRAELRGPSKQTLDRIADVLNRDYSSNTILIKGFTDTDPIRKSRWADNLELSLQRAAAVHRYLQKRGIDPRRMQAVGQGEWQPRGDKAKSRRVEIVVALTDHL